MSPLCYSAIFLREHYNSLDPIAPDFQSLADYIVTFHNDLLHFLLMLTLRVLFANIISLHLLVFPYYL